MVWVYFTRTHLLLTCPDTVTISLWRDGSIHSAWCCLVDIDSVGPYVDLTRQHALIFPPV